MTSTTQAPTSSSTTTTTNILSSEFTLRRAALVHEIGDSLESVLTQINALNRSLEGIIEIGNEFASVEALWSQFETVMGRGAEEDKENEHEVGEGGREEEYGNEEQQGDAGKS